LLTITVCEAVLQNVPASEYLGDHKWVTY